MIRPFISQIRKQREKKGRCETLNHPSNKNPLVDNMGFYGLMGLYGTILTKLQTGREGAEEVIGSGGCGVEPSNFRMPLL